MCPFRPFTPIRCHVTAWNAEFISIRSSRTHIHDILFEIVALVAWCEVIWWCYHSICLQVLRRNHILHNGDIRGQSHKDLRCHQSMMSYIVNFLKPSKMLIFRCMGSKFCVKFQRAPLKLHTKCWTHTSQNIHFTVFYFSSWFAISWNCDVISLSVTAPRRSNTTGYCIKWRNCNRLPYFPETLNSYSRAGCVHILW